MLNWLRTHVYYYLPAELQYAVLVKRRSRIWLREGIVFVHIPKAAGTSMNVALYGRFIGHIPAASIRRWGSARVNSLPSFAVTRNPWDRLVSAYRFVKAGGGIGDQRAGVWRPHLYQVPEFESFERFVFDWLSPRDPARLDGVFQPQWRFVCDSSGKPLVDHVGRFEDLAPTLDFVRKAIGRVLDLPMANRTGMQVDYRSYYSPELVDRVGRIYARDVETFGYSFEG